ncbi:MAG TPA: methyltransferase domain-containing protein [Alphaproteobacteria bacterium]|nr:methyltransferase domain-containing protein [Alphaproteobacteria bacterium]
MAAPLKLDWKTRFIAWWEGYDLSGLPRPKPSLKLDLSEEPAGPVSEYWSATRIEIAEIVWGPGFHTPGGEEHIPTLIKPFGLDESMSVLDLGAGLGGAARLMARVSNAWVTGLEEDPLLAHEGMERSVKAGLERRAPISRTNLEAVEFDKRYDAIFSKEAFFRVKHKDDLFELLQKGIKPRGQFLFTDYVLKHSAAASKAVTRWREGEEREVFPWTVNQVVDRLKRGRFDIRITEDITELHRNQIVSAWEKAMATFAEKKPADDETQKIIVSEAELWMRRVAALDTGDLRVFRFFALGPG